MSGRRKSLAAVFSFTSDKETHKESHKEPMDGNTTKPVFGSVTLKAAIEAAGKPNLISVCPSISISQALDIMKSNKIFSLPLKSRSSKGKFIGIVSTQDLLHYILIKCNHTLDEEASKALFDDSIENVLSLDADDESYRIWERDYRDTILTTGIAFSKGYHRALITDALGWKPTVILTQTDLIIHALACAETHKFATDLNSSIAATMGYCIRDVVKMSKLESALTGFLRLKEKKVPSMPIVDKGELIGTLSKSDLLGLDRESFMKLSSPVLHYLHQSRSTQVICIPSDSIKNVMDRMVENRVHRIWIVSSESEEIIGVVSQSDILGEILGVNRAFGLEMED